MKQKISLFSPPFSSSMLDVLLLCLCSTAISALPSVRVRPSSAVLPSSSDTRLVCESHDTPFLAVAYWTHAGQRIDLNPSVIEMHGNELRLFQFGDTAYTQPGAYACVVSTRYGLMESEASMLSLPTLDPFKASNTATLRVNITEGNIAVISCELPNANPRATPIFYFDQQRIEIEPNSKRYKVLPSGNLHIIDVKASDAGAYQCSAKNSLTGQMVNNSQTTMLHVLNKPLSPRERQPLSTIYKPRAASRVLVGDNFSIECVIAGWPKPLVEWEKYGDVLPEKRHEVSHGTLHLYDLKLDDRGTYICRASSATGQSDLAYTALLEVLEPPKLIQRPDSLVQISKDERTSIRCGFRGRPEPSISWLYNGEELTVTGGLLTLNQAKEGVYQCLGRNPYGTAQANIALVLPNQMPDEDLEPVKKSLIVFGPNNVTVSEGETVQLHCLTQAAATVQWLHNNAIINLNLMRRYEMLPSGGLRIVSAQKSDSGVYECLASKIGFGTSSARCDVHVQGLVLTLPVSKLEIVHLNQIQSNAVELSWKINETIENSLHAIQVQYRLIHSKSAWTTVDQFYNRSSQQVVVNNLQLDQAYKFRLIGFDGQGKQLVISAAKRLNLQPISPSPEITAVEANQQYELRLASYSTRGISPMSHSIEIATPAGTQRQRVNLDEIIENITRLQNPPSPVVTHKGSDLLYLTIGIVAGILLILILILIVMCVLRLVQRKKLISALKDGSDYYCDGVHKSVNADYAATPCMQHAVVSVDGKLIPFAYPSTTIRLNTNPLDDDKQENFYHTLTPFSCHSQYEDCSRNPSAEQKMIYARPSCPMHHTFDSCSPRHVVYQRLEKGKRILAPVHTEGSAPPSTMESPYHHWKYLTPLPR